MSLLATVNGPTTAGWFDWSVYYNICTDWGWHNYIAKAYDAAGNTKSANFSVYVDWWWCW